LRQEQARTAPAPPLNAVRLGERPYSILAPYGAGHVRGLDTVIIDLPGNLAYPQSQLDGLPVTLTAATARGAPALLPIFAKAG